jgi:hypothetical protein
MNAGYCTPYVEKASKFNGFTHANQYSYGGFIPCELPDRVKGAGETYGLRNANGDWIISLTAWWDHDPRAEQEYKKFILREAEALGRGRSVPPATG